VVVSGCSRPTDAQIAAIRAACQRRFAIRVFETSMRSLLEQCLFAAVQTSQATGGTIYLLPDGIRPHDLCGLDAPIGAPLLEALGIPRQQHSCIRATKDRVTTLGSNLPHGVPAPRVGGAGFRCLQELTPRFLSTSELELASPQMVAADIRNLCVFPLGWGDTAYGLVYLHNVAQDAGVFRRTLQLMQTASIIVGGATDRITTTRRRHQATALLKLGHAVTRHAARANPLYVIANEIYGFMGSDLVSAFQFGTTFRAYTAGRWGAEGAQPPIAWRDDRVRNEFTAVSALGPEPTLIRNLHQLKDDLRDPGFAACEQIATSIMVPLCNHGRCVGGLMIEYRQPQRFARWQLEELSHVSNIAALALGTDADTMLNAYMHAVGSGWPCSGARIRVA
jgi:GAF domain-containing protein